MDKTDLQNYRMFKKIVNGASYSIEGKATVQVALLFKWFDGLESKIEAATAPPVMLENSIKQIEVDDANR